MGFELEVGLFWDLRGEVGEIFLGVVSFHAGSSGQIPKPAWKGSSEDPRKGTNSALLVIPRKRIPSLGLGFVTVITR